MEVEVTTWHLEMTAPADLVPAPRPDLDLTLTRAGRPSPELNRFLYTAVGGGWYWLDRLPWTYERWLAWLSRAGVETWVAYVDGTPAGYFELDATAGLSVELAYFGLLPAFTGHGVGGWLLTEALRRAWALRPRRVWVHTCSLDGPNALANYRARGMRVCGVETAAQRLPDQPPGPWPGAGPAHLSRMVDNTTMSMTPGSMKMPKPSEDAKAAFAHLVPAGAAITMKPMFGNLAGFVNGNMFAGLFGEDLFVRLPDDEAAAVRGSGGRDFEPAPGRAMKGYVLVPPDWRERPREVAPLVERALELTSRMPAKAPGKAASSKSK